MQRITMNDPVSCILYDLTMKLYVLYSYAYLKSSPFVRGNQV